MNITIITHHPDWTGATGDHAFLFISESDPASMAAELTNNTNWRWYRPDTGEWRTYNASTEEWDLDQDGFNVLKVGDLTISGSCTSDGDAGITGTYTGTINRISIKNGIVTGLELA